MKSSRHEPAVFAACGISWWLVSAALASAGVVTDGSMGVSGAIGKVGNDFAIPHTLGTKVGGNLFHSFSELNLLSGESATFSGPGDVANILSRVTGGSASSIDGTLRSTIPGANLFLMNPKGVVFGPNAQLDVSGSFTVTTADYAKLADGKRWNAVPGPDDLLLSAAPVSAFGFLGPQPAPVTFNRSQLSVSPGNGLHVIAGDTSLTGASLHAPSGALTIFGAGSAGEVPFELATAGSGYATAAFGALGNITFGAQSLASIDGAGGGRVVIRSGKLTMTNGSSVTARTTIAGGDLHFETTGGVRLLSDSSIEAVTDGSGPAGNVTLIAGGPVQLNGDSQISSATSSLGDAGLVHIVAPSVSLSELAHISVSTTGADRVEAIGPPVGPRVSDLRVQLQIEHTFDEDLTVSLISPLGTRVQLFSEVGGSGNNFTDTLLTDGASNSIDTGRAPFTGKFRPDESLSAFDGQPLGGQWTLSVSDDADDSVGRLLKWSLLQGADSFVATNVPRIIPDSDAIHSGLTIDLPSETLLRHKAGDGGSILIEAGLLSIATRGYISARSSNSGAGGDVTIKGGTLEIMGSDNESFSGIFARSDPGAEPLAPHGRVGDIKIDADRLIMRGTTSISTSTLTPGLGGDVTINVRSASISGAGVLPPVFGGNIFADNAGIFAEARESGAAGRLTLTAETLAVTNGGLISTSTNGTGAAGALEIITHDLLFDGSDTDRFTGIFAATLPNESAQSGRGGAITVRATGEVQILNGAGIASSTLGPGDAGDIFVQAATGEISGTRRFRLFGPDSTPVEFGGISASSEGVASTGRSGNVSVRIGDLMMSDGGLITARATGRGDGGSVQVIAAHLALHDRAYISAGTLGSGDGGGVSVVSDHLTLDGLGTNISASTEPGSTGDGGTVRVQAGTLGLSHGGLISAETLGTGAGGDLEISAADLRVTGGGSAITVANGPAGLGASGSIQLAAGMLTLSDHARILAETSGPGRGGDLELTVDAARIRDGAAISADTRGAGRGGQLQLTFGDLRLDSGGSISATTSGRGAGGDITFVARDIVIEGMASGLFAESRGTQSGGAGGNIHVTTGTLDMNAGRISTSTAGDGNAGTVAVRARSATLTDGATLESSATAGGTAGSLSLQVESPLLLTGGSALRTTSALTSAGQIDVQSSASIALEESTISVQALAGDAGSISLRTPDTLSLRRSQVLAAAGLDGGNVSIAARRLVLDGSAISANAIAGAGGLITLAIDADGVLGGPGDFVIVSRNVSQSADSHITASSEAGIQGTLAINAPLFDLASSLAELTGALVDTSLHLQERCVMRLGAEVSSFLAIGRGGVEASPEEVPVRAAPKLRFRHPARGATQSQ